MEFLHKKFLYALYLFSSILTLVFNSCEKNNEFGLEIDPDSNSLKAIYSDSFDLNTFTVFTDSINTDELAGPSPLGNYIDPIFGEVNASIYTQLRIEKSVDFTPLNGSLDDLVVDSVVLYLAIDGYYGNIEEQNFIIEILENEIYKDSIYYNTQNIATKNLNISTSGSIKSDPLFPGYFSGYLVNQAMLGITLDIEEFAKPIINESGNSTLTGNDGENGFLSFFKGIKISTPKGTNGGLYYIDLLNSLSKVRMFYRDTSEISSQHDTIEFDFNINFNCAYFHNVEHDYSGTVIEDALLNPNYGENQFYVQTLGGVNGRLIIPEIDSLINKNIIINKGEIIFPFENYIFDEYQPPSALFISRKNNEGYYEFLPDLFEGNHGGSYDQENKNYKFNITRHLNEILSGKINNDTIKIFPNGNGITANRVVLNGKNSTKKDKAKIIISYTKY